MAERFYEREMNVRMGAIVLFVWQIFYLSISGCSLFKNENINYDNFDWYLTIYNPKDSEVADLNAILDSIVIPKSTRYDLPLKGAKISCYLSEMQTDSGRSLECDGFYIAMDCADGENVLPHFVVKTDNSSSFMVSIECRKSK